MVLASPAMLMLAARLPTNPAHSPSGRAGRDLDSDEPLSRRRRARRPWGGRGRSTARSRARWSRSCRGSRASATRAVSSALASRLIADQDQRLFFLLARRRQRGRHEPEQKRPCHRAPAGPAPGARRHPRSKSSRPTSRPRQLTGTSPRPRDNRAASPRPGPATARPPSPRPPHPPRSRTTTSCKTATTRTAAVPAATPASTTRSPSERGRAAAQPAGALGPEPGRRRHRHRGLGLLVAQRLHLLDVALDLGPFVGRDLLGLGEVVLERVDRLCRLAHLLMAAANVAQVDGMQRLRVQLREEVQRLIVAAGGEGLACLHLGGVIGPRVGTDCKHQHQNRAQNPPLRWLHLRENSTSPPTSESKAG